MLPPQADIELPLLQVLAEMGGSGRPREIYPRVTAKFPHLTNEELDERVDSGNNRWTNRIQWTRQALIQKGEMDSPQRGTWAITALGRQRLSQDGSSPSEERATSSTLVELYEQYEQQFRSNLLDKLYDLTPVQFEVFSKKLLSAYGFVRTTVTAVSNDGGVDGHGLLKVGLARMNVAFQCKRWQGNVPRPDVDKFRGAIQGEYEQGIFFTTSDFTKGAMEASIRKGAVPIVLLNGESIVDLMIAKQFGVLRKPLEVFSDQLERILTEDA